VQLRTMAAVEKSDKVYNPFTPDCDDSRDFEHFPSYEDAFPGIDTTKPQEPKPTKPPPSTKRHFEHAAATSSSSGSASSNASSCSLSPPQPIKGHGKNMQSNRSGGTSQSKNKSKFAIKLPSSTPSRKPVSRVPGDYGCTPVPNSMVTPAVTKKNKARGRQKNKRQQNKVLMMADLMSPTPNQYELSSPVPQDKNARLLTQTPVNFKIVLPPTPSTARKSATAREEKWCQDYFRRHVPVLTPLPQRENPVKLYDPAKDANATMMLKQSEPVFKESSKKKKKTKKKVKASPMERMMEMGFSMISPGNSNPMASASASTMTSSKLGSTFGASGLGLGGGGSGHASLNMDLSMSAVKMPSISPIVLATHNMEKGAKANMISPSFLSGFHATPTLSDNGSLSGLSDIKPKASAKAGHGVSLSPAFGVSMIKAHVGHSKMGMQSASVDQSSFLLPKGKALQSPVLVEERECDELHEVAQSPVNPMLSADMTTPFTPNLMALERSDSVGSLDGHFSGMAVQKAKRNRPIRQATCMADMNGSHRQSSNSVHEQVQLEHTQHALQQQRAQQEHEEQVQRKAEVTALINEFEMDTGSDTMQTQTLAQTHTQTQIGYEQNGLGFEDDLFPSADEMSDSEFFATTNTATQATQTKPVVVFMEEDIPKIRFNGKLLADCSNALSMSAPAINYFSDELLNESLTSTKSASEVDRVRSAKRGFGEFAAWQKQTPVLRHDTHSILYSPFDGGGTGMAGYNSDGGMTSEEEDSDGENAYGAANGSQNFGNPRMSLGGMGASGMISCSKSYDANAHRTQARKGKGKHKKGSKRDSNQMLREYKQSKLAKNPNWTICNAHDEKGDLLI